MINGHRRIDDACSGPVPLFRDALERPGQGGRHRMREAAVNVVVVGRSRFAAEDLDAGGYVGFSAKVVETLIGGDRLL